MSYTALARKWRPRSFAELVGQEHVRRSLVNALASGRALARGGAAEASALKPLLTSFPSDGMTCWPVSAQITTSSITTRALLNRLSPALHQRGQCLKLKGVFASDTYGMCRIQAQYSNRNLCRRSSVRNLKNHIRPRVARHSSRLPSCHPDEKTRSLRHHVKIVQAPIREDRNGQSTGTHAKASCVRESHHRPSGPGRVQAEAD